MNFSLSFPPKIYLFISDKIVDYAKTYMYTENKVTFLFVC